MKRAIFLELIFCNLIKPKLLYITQVQTVISIISQLFNKAREVLKQKVK